LQAYHAPLYMRTPSIPEHQSIDAKNSGPIRDLAYYCMARGVSFLSQRIFIFSNNGRKKIRGAKLWYHVGVSICGVSHPR
jgi:hypothetical protein